MTARAPAQSSSQRIRDLADALERLRARAGPDAQGMTQEEAAVQLGVSRQTWSRYEHGEVQDILREDRQEQLAHALGFTRDDLMDERDNVVVPPAGAFPGPPRRAEPRTREPAAAPRQVVVRARPHFTDEGALRYAQDQAVPIDISWVDAADFIHLAEELPGVAHAGQIVSYLRTRYPSRGQGCVVETRDGELRLGIYSRRTAAGVEITEGEGEGAQAQTIPTADLVGVYLIVGSWTP